MFSQQPQPIDSCVKQCRSCCCFELKVKVWMRVVLVKLDEIRQIYIHVQLLWDTYTAGP